MVTQQMVMDAKPFTGASETAVRMMLRYPWFMVLYYSMALYEVRWPKSKYWHQTLGTNGVSLWVDPDFWAQLDRDQRLTAVAHELGHKMLLHSTRRGDRHPIIWNIAGDYVINLMLVQSGFVPLDGLIINGKAWSWCYDKRFEDMTTEQVYDIIAQEYQDQADKAGSGSGSDEEGEGDADSAGAEGQDSDADVGSGTGQRKRPTAGKIAERKLGIARDLVDFGTTPAGAKDAGDGRPQESSADFEQRVRKELKQVEQMSRMAGNTPAWLKALLANADHAKVKWYEVLENYLKSLVRADYSWRRFNKRELVKTGCISPDMWTPAMGGLVVFVDCSGSCWNDLPHFNMHFKDIVDQMKPAWVEVRYFQTHVFHEIDQRFERGDFNIELQPSGGGGTSFAWLRDEIEMMEEQPEAAIVLTDLEGAFGPEPDQVPVLWASVSHIEEAPFGEVININ